MKVVKHRCGDVKIILKKIVTIIAILIIDFIRAIIVRQCNWHWCCFDLEAGWLGYGEFKIAENVLALW